MKKNTLLLLALFGLLAAVTYYFLPKKNIKSTMIAPEQSFSTDAESVYKIFIADRANHRITVSRTTGQWLVNEKHTVKKDVIENLLETVSKMTIKYVPSKNAVKTMIEDIAAHGLKVELYGKNGEVLKTFYVGNTDVEGTGTYAILENSNNPYVLHIPGFNGELKPRFPIAEDEWRDRTIFAYELENIQSISVDYPEQKSASFKIDNQVVTPFHTGVPALQNQKKGAVISYLTNFKSIVAEAVENSNPLKDSIARLLPFATISLKDTKNQEMSVRILPIFPKDIQGNVLRDIKPDRYFAISNKGDFYLIQDVVFRKLFWDYKAFFQ